MEDILEPGLCEFWKGKSCLDQMYVLNGVVRNRFNENKDIFLKIITTCGIPNTSYRGRFPQQIFPPCKDVTG